MTVEWEVSWGSDLLNEWLSIQGRASLPGWRRRQQRQRTWCWSTVCADETTWRVGTNDAHCHPVWRTPAGETSCLSLVERSGWRWSLKSCWTSVPQRPSCELRRSERFCIDEFAWLIVVSWLYNVFWPLLLKFSMLEACDWRGTAC